MKDSGSSIRNPQSEIRNPTEAVPWQDLIGTAWALGGQDRRIGLNCYGLVREVYRYLRIELPARSEDVLSAELAEAEARTWRRVDDPRPYDVALIRSTSGLHLAVMTPEGTLLHSARNVGVILTRPERLAERIIGWYRYKSGPFETLTSAHHSSLDERPSGLDALSLKRSAPQTQCSSSEALVSLPAAGDGDAGRIIGGILVAVAALGAAVITGGAGIPALGIGGLNLGPLAGAAAGMLVSMAGNMVVNALMPQSLPNTDGYGLKQSATYTWDGIYNEARQGAAVPMLFGTMRAAGQVIAENTWKSFDGDDFLDMLLAPCAGPVTRLTDPEINDTNADYFKGIGTWFREGDDEQTVIDAFNRIVVQYASGAKVPYDPSETDPEEQVVFSSKGKIGAFRIVVGAPQGLWYLVDGNPVALIGAAAVTFRIQYKRSSESSWTDLATYTPGPEQPFTWQDQGTFTYEGGVLYTHRLTHTSHSDCSRWWKVLPLATFALYDGAGTQYWCDLQGYGYDDDGYPYITFQAHTNAARTTHKTTALTNGVYTIAGHDFEMTTSPASPPSGVSSHYCLFRFAASGYGFEANLRPGINEGQSITGEQTFTIYYKPTSSGTWTKWDDVERTGGPAWLAVKVGLASGTYDICIHFAADTRDASHQNWAVILDVLKLYSSATETEFTIEGSAVDPRRAVARSCENLAALTYDYYDFRIWRTKTDHDDVIWCDDIFVTSYAEIVDEALAYPGIALMGLRVQATGRLSGSRPKVTSLVTGGPLSVPAVGDRYAGTIIYDYGIMDDDASPVNGVAVAGLRKLRLRGELPTPEASGNPYYWMVFTDETGYAQDDRLLTKPFARIRTWDGSALGDPTDTYTVYVAMTEELPGASRPDLNIPVMLFCADDVPGDGYHAPTDHTAWAVAKALIDGSRGRITASHIDWDSFADWDTWNEGTVDGERRNTFDGIVDFQNDLWGTALAMAKTARGILVASGGLYKVVVDKAATPVMVLSEGNNCKARVDLIPRHERANVITASFLDVDQNYAQRDVTEEDIESGEYPIINTMGVVVGVTRETQLRRLMRYMLAVNRNVNRIITLEAGPDAAAAEVGDVFYFQSPVADGALGGRIKEVSGGNVVLDRTVPEAGTYNLYIWGADQVYSSLGQTLAEGATEVACPTGFTQTSYYEYPYMLCLTSWVRTKYRALSVRRSPGTMNTTITGIEYADEVYTDD